MEKNAPRVMFNFMEDDVSGTNESNITIEIEDEDDAEGKVDTLDVPEPVNLKEEVNEENIFDRIEQTEIKSEPVEEPIVKKTNC